MFACPKYWYVPILCLLVTLPAVPANAEIPRLINYQGRVTDSGGTNVPDGSYTARFRIYASATGGSPLWDSNDQSVQINGGVFEILLGDDSQPTLNLAFDQSYWLQVTFEGNVQSPRARLAATGYAYMASGLVPGTLVSGEVISGTFATIKGLNTATTGLAYGIWGESQSGQGGGVVGMAPAFGVGGQATATVGICYGVMGTTASSEGKGVFGKATAATGQTCGGEFETVSPSGRGVRGIASATSGLTYGGFFESMSTTGRGVLGMVTSTTGVNYGLTGQTASPEGFGVYGLANAYSGIGCGVHGYSHGTAGRGVWGKADDATGYTIGVLGESTSQNGTGIEGAAYATTGTTYGVYGVTYSSTGHGVRAMGTAAGAIGLSARGGPGGYAAKFEGNVLLVSRDSDDVIMELGEGLDYAEGFDISGAGEINAGSVLIIDSEAPGKLTLSRKPYDRRVAGIVAGAHGLGSAVRVGAGFDHDVALTGRVYCNVDATTDGVSPGDLLTTSSVPGYAMKATDHVRAQGAILGKAMEVLHQGQRGQILVLVTLQ